MSYTAVFQVPTSTRKKLESMSRGNMSYVIKELITAHKDVELTPQQDPPARLGVVCDPDTLSVLDEIKEKNNLKSRNQAITLLIERAWQQSQQT